jgi:hypothetical protein
MAENDESLYADDVRALEAQIEADSEDVESLKQTLARTQAELAQTKGLLAHRRQLRAGKKGNYSTRRQAVLRALDRDRELRSEAEALTAEDRQRTQEISELEARLTEAVRVKGEKEAQLREIEEGQNGERERVTATLRRPMERVFTTQELFNVPAVRGPPFAMKFMGSQSLEDTELISESTSIIDVSSISRSSLTDSTTLESDSSELGQDSCKVIAQKGAMKRTRTVVGGPDDDDD